MPTAETISNITAFLALIVAGIAVWRSSSENIRANVLRELQISVANSHASAAQSHAAAALTHVEIEVQRDVETAKKALTTFVAEHSVFFTRDEASLQPGEAKHRAVLQQSLKQIIEAYLTAIDSACKRYDAGQVGGPWFEHEFKREIRQLVEGDEYTEILSKPGHPYKTLMHVYHKWEDPRSPKQK